VLGERKGQRARRSRIFFFVISDLYELERREEDTDDDVCVYNKKEMIVYHHPKDVVLSDCFDGGLWRERQKR